jgi:Concanavalin A-like lectin/glucanases superfamily
MATQTTSINSSGTLYVAGGIDEVMISTGSVLFNGSSQYLKITSSLNFFSAFGNLGTGSKTIEFWTYYIASGAGDVGYTYDKYNIFGNWVASAVNGRFALGINNFDKVSFVYTTGVSAASVVYTTASVPKGTWTHIAFVCVGTTAITIYINGVRETLTVDLSSHVGASAVVNDTTVWYNIGGQNQTGAGGPYTGYYNGYISNFRIVNGVAVYSTNTNFTPPTAPLTSVYNTVFLLNKIYGQSNANNIIDSSVYQSTVTNVGSAVATNVNPFYAGEVGSLRFDGSSQYLTAQSSSTAWTFGTGAFTIELWAYITSGSTYQFLLGNNVNVSGYMMIGINVPVTGTQTIAIGASGVNWPVQFGNSITFSSNTWYHIAITRTGTTNRAFINGVQLGSNITDSTSWSFSANTPWIGNQSGGTSFGGYISNLRIVNGQAIYATNFTVPTQPLSTGVYTTQTSLLLTTPFASSSTAFKDSSINNFTVTNVGGTTATTFTPFISNLSNAPSVLNTVERINTLGLQSAGEIDEITLAQGSMVFNGSTTRVTLPFGFINPGSQDFTIEGWVYPLSSTIAAFFVGQADLTTAGGSSIVCYINGGASTSDLYVGAGGAAITSPTCPVGQWSHVAYVRYGATGGTWRSYLNGALTSSTSITGAVNVGSTTYPPSIGGFMDSARNMFNGYISNHRIVVGTAVYTSSTFTTPILPLTSIPNTRSLFSSPNSSQLVQDFSTASNTTTNVGGVTGTGLNPFATVGSANFNGVNQNLILSTAASGPLDLATGAPDWTVECWFYPLTVSGSQAIFWKGGATGSVNPSYALWLSGATPQWIVGNGAGGGGTQNLSALTANKWYHFALIRSGGYLNNFVNGVAGTPTAIAFTLANTSNPSLSIGNSTADGSSRPFLGYISNFRIVKGVAVYSTNTNFTPPTSPLTAVGTQTSLLLNTPYGTQFIKDFSPNNLSVTSTNATTSTIINPFIGYLGNPASLTGTVQRVSGQGLQVSGSFDEFSMNRGSIQFNGSSQLLTVPTNTAFVFGTGDFTVEGWYYFNSIAADNGLILLGTGANGGSNFSAWWLRYNPTAYGNAVLAFYRYDGTETTNNFSFPTSNYLVTNTWYHIACSRQGTNLRMFLNGAQVGTTITSSLNFASVNSDPLQIGKVITGGGTFYFNGYASNIRVIKGVAIYSTNTNFTPPTQPFSSTDIYSTQTSILLNTVAYRPLNTVDSSLNNFTVTPIASPLPSELNPFR